MDRTPTLPLPYVRDSSRPTSACPASSLPDASCPAPSLPDASCLAPVRPTPSSPVSLWALPVRSAAARPARSCPDPSAARFAPVPARQPVTRPPAPSLIGSSPPTMPQIPAAMIRPLGSPSTPASDSASATTARTATANVIATSSRSSVVRAGTIALASPYPATPKPATTTRKPATRRLKAIVRAPATARSSDTPRRRQQGGNEAGCITGRAMVTRCRSDGQRFPEGRYSLLVILEALGYTPARNNPSCHPGGARQHPIPGQPAPKDLQTGLLATCDRGGDI